MMLVASIWAKRGVQQNFGFSFLSEVTPRKMVPKVTPDIELVVTLSPFRASNISNAIWSTHFRRFMRKFFVLSTLIVLVAECRPQSKYDMKPGIGMGSGGMSDRHHAQVPKVYAGMRSPDINENMLAIGAAVYETYCASCHGIEGMGNDPAGSTLVPAPAPVAHTSQMLSDAYLFWRTIDGGADFNSAMPAWKDVLS